MQNLRNKIILKKPADTEHDMWKSALPLGNGITGALVYGAISEETAIITRHDMWRSRQKLYELPDVSYTLKKAREFIDSGDYSSAYGYLNSELQKKGYLYDSSAECVLLGALKINYIHSGLCFKHYRRGIDMQNGAAFIKWEDGAGKHTRNVFVSRDNGIIYINTKSDVKCRFNIDFDIFDNGTGGANREKELRKDNTEKLFTDSTLCYSANTDGTPFGAVMSIVLNDADGICRHNGSDSFITAESSDFTVKIKTFCEKDRESTVERLKAELAAAPGYEEALAAHSALHSALYGSVDIELTPDDDKNLLLTNEELLDLAYEDEMPAALLEKLWRFGRYLTVSGSTEGSNPFALYGLWFGEYNLNWNANVCNENVQIIHWHMLAGNLSFAVKNLIDYYYSKIPQCRINAQRLFGCRGILIPVYTTPPTMDGINCTLPQICPLIMQWISVAGWVSLHFYEYYKYTKDIKTLNEKILPFMVEAAKFYEDYTVFDENGKCRIYPSVSPENTPANQYECVVQNALVDFAAMKGLFSHIFELLREDGAECDIPAETLEKWKKIYDAIPEYKANSDGAVKEWLSDDLEDNYEHRHFSHLFPFFPGDEITPESDEKLVGMFRKAADMRIVKAQSGWSFAHSANIWTKFGDGNRAFHILNIMSKSCILNNFMSLHNDWRHMGASIVMDGWTPVQLDANMGFVNAVQTMLVQCDKDTLRILPALPDMLSYAKVRDICIPRGKVSLLLNGNTAEVSVKTDTDCTLCLIAPDGSRSKLECRANEPQQITVQLKN